MLSKLLAIFSLSSTAELRDKANKKKIVSNVNTAFITEQFHKREIIFLETNIATFIPAAKLINEINDVIFTT